MNALSLYFLTGNSVNLGSKYSEYGLQRAILDIEYQKVGGKYNYDLLNQAQRIQFEQSIPQLKQFISTNGGDVSSTGESTSPSQNVLDPKKILQIQSGAAIEWNKNAEITVIEYSDMECPYCIKQYHDTKLKEKLLAQYPGKVNFVFKNHRGVDHPGTEKKALAALCAQKVWGDSAYISYYSAIMSGTLSQANIYPVDSLAKLALDQKLDVKSWQSCIDSRDMLSIFEAQTKEAYEYWLDGTPGTLIINNTNGAYTTITGAYPYTAFTQKIDTLLKK
jgi:protein-disulfide isomerase